MPVTINGTTGITTPAVTADSEVAQVAFYARATAPTGWLVCDGSAVSRTTYAALFSAIGTLYGVGDGLTTFNLPDLRGEFIRGLDGGRGVDTGRALGSAQGGEMQSHSHSGSTNSAGDHAHTARSARHTSGSGGGTGDIQLGSSNFSSNLQTLDSGTVSISTAGAHSHTVTIGNTGGTETRPRNVALLPCIKF